MFYKKKHLLAVVRLLLIVSHANDSCIPMCMFALGCWLQLSSRALCRGAGYLSCLAYVHTCFRHLLLYSSKTGIRHVHLVHVCLSCQVQSATATTAALLSWYVQVLG